MFGVALAVEPGGPKSRVFVLCSIPGSGCGRSMLRSFGEVGAGDRDFGFDAGPRNLPDERFAQLAWLCAGIRGSRGIPAGGISIPYR